MFLNFGQILVWLVPLNSGVTWQSSLQVKPLSSWQQSKNRNARHALPSYWLGCTHANQDTGCYIQSPYNSKLFPWLFQSALKTKDPSYVPTQKDLGVNKVVVCFTRNGNKRYASPVFLTNQQMPGCADCASAEKNCNSSKYRITRNISKI